MVAISRRDAAEIGRRYGTPADRLSVVYNGVDLDRFHPDHARAPPPSDARGARPVGPRLAGPVRGVGLRAERARPADRGPGAARRPARGASSWRARATAAPYQLRADALGLGSRVHWLGPRTDVERLYAMADAVALPARYEPFGNVHLEALASGLPVLTSSRTGGAEIVDHGQNGWVVGEPSDPAEVARGPRGPPRPRPGPRTHGRAEGRRAVHVCRAGRRPCRHLSPPRLRLARESSPKPSIIIEHSACSHYTSSRCHLPPEPHRLEACRLCRPARGRRRRPHRRRIPLRQAGADLPRGARPHPALQRARGAARRRRQCRPQCPRARRRGRRRRPPRDRQRRATRCDALFRQAGMATAGLIRVPDRPTPVKTRIMAGGDQSTRQQVVRLDREPEAGLAPDAEARLIARLETESAGAQAFLVSDYGYGTVTPRVFELVLELARARGPARHRGQPLRSAALPRRHRGHAERARGGGPDGRVARRRGRARQGRPGGARAPRRAAAPRDARQPRHGALRAGRAGHVHPHSRQRPDRGRDRARATP